MEKKEIHCIEIHKLKSMDPIKPQIMFLNSLERRNKWLRNEPLENTHETTLCYFLSYKFK